MNTFLVNYFYFYFSQHFETERRGMENQNLLLINQNKSMSENYDELRIKNQTLGDELNVLKTSL